MPCLESQELAFGGHMTVAMVLMESPAIVMALFLAVAARRRQADAITPAAPASVPNGVRHVLHEAFTDGAHLLLIGAGIPLVDRLRDRRSLGITFPINLLIGIPLYTQAARAVLS